MPTLNRPVLLAEALRSLQAQTLADWEALVVDDGSPEASRAVVEGLADPRVRYLEQAHAGRSAARNRGLAHARGRHVALLDDDDRYLPDKLALETAFLEAHPEVDLVGTGAVVEREPRPRGTWEPWRVRPAPSLPGLLLHGNAFLTCSVLFRRPVLDRVGPWFDRALEPAEDADFFLRLAAVGVRMAWLRHVTAVYRLRRRPVRTLLMQRSAYRRALQKVLARADVPPEIRGQRSLILSRFHLTSGCRWYTLEQVLPAQRDFLQALLLMPGLARTDADAAVLLELVVRTAREPLWVTRSPDAYVDFVFDHLPSPLRGLRALRDRAHDALRGPEAMSAAGSS